MSAGCAPELFSRTGFSIKLLEPDSWISFRQFGFNLKTRPDRSHLFRTSYLRVTTDESGWFFKGK